ncbi:MULTISPECIES: hypothetical protein [Halomonas]|uniref:hypothetical protein n=1 Tax=Halomonas TaxID=2745 RepID=UPI0018664A45|nr:hypothetical protein [Halomonas citrativorans]
MKTKLKVLLGAIFLAGLLAMVFLACQMTFVWWQAKPDSQSVVAELIWKQHGGYVLLVWAVLLWLVHQLFGNQRRRAISSKE